MTDFDLGPEIIARVREASDIVAVISDQVRLKRRGRTWEGLCPFHEEKTPSFSVDAEKGLYYCFGCHQGGDIFKFVMTQQNLSFPETVEMLARRFGVPLPPRSPGAGRRRREVERLRSILQEAQRWFVDQLHLDHGAAARRELERRGFAPPTWTDFDFGWAPDDWRRLLDHLRARHPEGGLIEAGLVVRPEGGDRPYDRFRNRLMFPIRGGDGRLIAFGGRILGDGEPKYLNSPEGKLFHKRSTLFGLDLARREIAATGTAIVVEGYFDCLSLHRVGVANAVATLGTALTTDHGRLLRRLLGTDGRVLLCYDADSAGRRAAAAGARVLLEAGIDVALITLAGGKDPDDIIRVGGAEAFRALAAAPTPLLDFLFADAPADPAERRRSGLALAPLVCSAADPAIRHNLIDELARRLDLRPRDIEGQARGPRAGRPPAADADSQHRDAHTPPGEQDLARILLQGPESAKREAAERVDPDLLADGRVAALLNWVRGRDPGSDIVASVIGECDDENLKRFVARLCAAGDPDVTEAGAGATLAQVLKRQRRLKARALQGEIEQASARGDSDALAGLLAEKARLTRG